MNHHQAAEDKKRIARWIWGILIGNLVMGLFYFGIFEFSNFARSYDLLILPSFFLVPFTGGIVASFVWRKNNPRVGLVMNYSAWMTLLAFLIAGAFFNEGVICLAIVSPIFFVFIMAGGLLGRVLFRGKTGRLQISILPMIAMITLVDSFQPTGEMGVISDTITIKAPARTVWPEVTSFPEIPGKPDFWLFKMGLPYPVSTTKSGDYVDADRACNFSGGAVFREKVAEIVPDKKLTFNIVEIPQDPELIGHLSPHRGQFLLHENEDGSTTLTGNTWYTLQVRPVWYFDLWTEYIFRAVHLRVMNDIKRRAELKASS